MCGITGYVCRKRIERDVLSRMNDSMQHRGPNDAGAELYDAADGYTVGLAQRRLSILDLSPLGHQPMESADGRLEIVYNGEIYNFLELKKELADYPYKSTCDTEVILAAYLKWGIRMADHINGMFAIALYDRTAQKLFLIRDRIGKKPLYYAIVDENGNSPEKPASTGGEGAGLVFASELKPIMLWPGFRKEIRKDVLPRYLYHQYINAPYTIFENTYKLEPGCILTFDIGNPQNAPLVTGFDGAAVRRKGTADDLAEGICSPKGFCRTRMTSRISIEKFWDIAEVYKTNAADPVTDYEEAKKGLKDVLMTAMRERMIADVPLGCFLSGGYDSSLTSALAQEISVKKNGKPLRTFCIGFNEQKYNEAQFAGTIAQHLGTDHTELYIGEEEMEDLVSSIPYYFDEPFADSSQIPTMLVSMLAKKDVTVVLSGDGGDEFFCGYGIYEGIRKAQKLDLIGAAAHAFGQIPAGRTKLEWKYPIRAQIISMNRDPETKTQFGSVNYMRNAYRFLGADVEKRILPDGTECFPIGYPIESRYSAKNWQIRRMLLDMDTYLPGDILCKVDRASMKYSLETRCPILDTNVMEYSFRIPHEFKYRNGEKKAILKDLCYDYIPKEMLDRPKKGFSVPLDKWLRGPLREQLQSAADPSFLKKQGIFDPDFVSGYVDSYLRTGDAGPSTGANYSRMAWSFLVFQMWYEIFMKQG